MLGRNRIFAALFTIVPISILVLGGLYGLSLHDEYSKDREQAASQSGDQANARIDACREVPGFIAQVSCVGKAISAEREEDASYKDLKAQQHMSIWAYGMAITSLAALSVTAVGVVYVYFTLKETSAGVVVMRKEQRPWLSISDPTPVSVYADQPSLTHPKCNIFIEASTVIENTGKTPAIDVSVKFLASNGHRNEIIEEAQESAMDADNMHQNVFSIGPGERYPVKRRAHVQVIDDYRREGFGGVVWFAVVVGYRATHVRARNHTSHEFALIVRDDNMSRNEIGAQIVPTLFKSPNGGRSSYSLKSMYFRRMRGTMT
jgi:hypothetical protein